jgi:hypothetical protein
MPVLQVEAAMAKAASPERLRKSLLSAVDAALSEGK